MTWSVIPCSPLGSHGIAGLGYDIGFWGLGGDTSLRLGSKGLDGVLMWDTGTRIEDGLES